MHNRPCKKDHNRTCVKRLPIKTEANDRDDVYQELLAMHGYRTVHFLWDGGRRWDLGDGYAKNWLLSKKKEGRGSSEILR